MKDDPFDLPLEDLTSYFWSRTADGKLEYVSPSVCKYNGLTFEQTDDWVEYTHKDDIHIREQGIARAVQTGEAQEFQVRYRNAHGGYEWFATIVHTQRNERGEVLRIYGMHWNIHNHKTEQEQLRQRNMTLEAMSELFPGHVWMARPDGSAEYHSPSIREYTGVAGEPSCESYESAIHPDDIAANKRYQSSLIAGQDPGELELRLRRADGIYRWFLCRTQAVRETNGDVVRWVGLNWDINDRKIAESRLRTEEENYRRIVDCVPACVCVGNAAGKLVYVNKVGLAALGASSDEVTGDLWMNFIHPSEQDTAREHWASCIKSGAPLDVIVRMLQRDGVYRWQHLISEPLRDDNGSIVSWYLVGIEVDGAVKAQEALVKSEKEARELLDRLPGRFATRTTIDYDFVNRNMLEETGITLEDLQKFGFLHFIYSDDQARVKASFLTSVEKKSVCETTYRWRHADGKYRWHHSRSVPYLNEDGTVYKWYTMNLDIDDLYQSKELIREREAQLNWLTDAVPGFLWQAAANGSIEYMNKRAENYTGRSLDGVTENGWFDLVHPDDYETVIDAWNSAISTGVPFDAVHRIRAADGSYRWFQGKATALRDAKGEVTNWYGLLTDIHERKLVEESLRREEMHLRRLIDALPAMIWRATPAGNLDRWNRRMLAFIGKTWDEIDGPRFLQLIPEDDRLRVRDHWRAAVARGVNYEDTYQVTGADGKLHWYLSRGEPFRDENGEVLHWYGTCTNIDDLKQAEAALKQREHQLREITETIPGMIWCTDAAGQPTYINRRTTEYAGVEVPELVNLGYQKAIHPDDWDGLIKAFSHSVETGEPYRYVHRLRRKDGEYHWYQQMAEALRDADGNIVQWYGLSIDIDERVRTEDRLRHVQTELARASRVATVAELSASIAHELNQPLTAVIANAQAGLRWLGANPPNLGEVKVSLGSILRDGRGADDTMQSIRALFKRETISKSSRNVSELVQDAVRLLKEDPSKRHAVIDLQLSDSLPTVYVDQIQIQQVLINLMTNAIEAVEGTSRTPHVVVSAHVEADGSIGIQVMDNGTGIHNTDDIFDAFVTSKAKGMGIGLAVSRSIIEAHDGTLAGQNNEAEGATFAIKLPVLSLSEERSSEATN